MGVEVKYVASPMRGMHSIHFKREQITLVLFFILNPPRHITLEDVKQICESLKDISCKKVAVDVIPKLEDVALMQKAGFQYYQFHFPLDLEKDMICQWSELVGPSNLWLAP